MEAGGRHKYTGLPEVELSFINVGLLVLFSVVAVCCILSQSPYTAPRPADLLDQGLAERWHKDDAMTQISPIKANDDLPPGPCGQSAAMPLRVVAVYNTTVAARVSFLQGSTLPWMSRALIWSSLDQSQLADAFHALVDIVAHWPTMPPTCLHRSTA